MVRLYVYLTKLTFNGALICISDKINFFLFIICDKYNMRIKIILMLSVINITVGKMPTKQNKTITNKNNLNADTITKNTTSKHNLSANTVTKTTEKTTITEQLTNPTTCTNNITSTCTSTCTSTGSTTGSSTMLSNTPSNSASSGFFPKVSLVGQVGSLKGDSLLNGIFYGAYKKGNLVLAPDVRALLNARGDIEGNLGFNIGGLLYDNLGARAFIYGDARKISGAIEATGNNTVFKGITLGGELLYKNFIFRKMMFLPISDEKIVVENTDIGFASGRLSTNSVPALKAQPGFEIEAGLNLGLTTRNNFQLLLGGYMYGPDLLDFSNPDVMGARIRTELTHLAGPMEMKVGAKIEYDDPNGMRPMLTFGISNANTTETEPTDHNTRILNTLSKEPYRDPDIRTFVRPLAIKDIKPEVLDTILTKHDTTEIAERIIHDPKAASVISHKLGNDHPAIKIIHSSNIGNVGGSSGINIGNNIGTSNTFTGNGVNGSNNNQNFNGNLSNRNVSNTNLSNSTSIDGMNLSQDRISQYALAGSEFNNAYNNASDGTPTIEPMDLAQMTIDQMEMEQSNLAGESANTAFSMLYNPMSSHEFSGHEILSHYNTMHDDINMDAMDTDGNYDEDEEHYDEDGVLPVLATPPTHTYESNTHASQVSSFQTTSHSTHALPQTTSIAPSASINTYANTHSNTYSSQSAYTAQPTTASYAEAPQQISVAHTTQGQQGFVDPGTLIHVAGQAAHYIAQNPQAIAQGIQTVSVVIQAGRKAVDAFQNAINNTDRNGDDDGDDESPVLLGKPNRGRFGHRKSYTDALGNFHAFAASGEEHPIDRDSSDNINNNPLTASAPGIRAEGIRAAGRRQSNASNMAHSTVLSDMAAGESQELDDLMNSRRQSQVDVAISTPPPEALEQAQALLEAHLAAQAAQSHNHNIPGRGASISINPDNNNLHVVPTITFGSPIASPRISPNGRSQQIGSTGRNIGPSNIGPAASNPSGSNSAPDDDLIPVVPTGNAVSNTPLTAVASTGNPVSNTPLTEQQVADQIARNAQAAVARQIALGTLGASRAASRAATPNPQAGNGQMGSGQQGSSLLTSGPRLGTRSRSNSMVNNVAATVPAQASTLSIPVPATAQAANTQISTAQASTNPTANPAASMLAANANSTQDILSRQGSFNREPSETIASVTNLSNTASTQATAPIAATSSTNLAAAASQRDLFSSSSAVGKQGRRKPSENTPIGSTFASPAARDSTTPRNQDSTSHTLPGDDETQVNLTINTQSVRNSSSTPMAQPQTLVQTIEESPSVTVQPLAASASSNLFSSSNFSTSNLAVPAAQARPLSPGVRSEADIAATLARARAAKEAQERNNSIASTPPAALNPSALNTGNVANFRNLTSPDQQPTLSRRPSFAGLPLAPSLTSHSSQANLNRARGSVSQDPATSILHNSLSNSGRAGTPHRSTSPVALTAMRQDTIARSRTGNGSRESNQQAHTHQLVSTFSSPYPSNPEGHDPAFGDLFASVNTLDPAAVIESTTSTPQAHSVATQSPALGHAVPPAAAASASASNATGSNASGLHAPGSHATGNGPKAHSSGGTA